MDAGSFNVRLIAQVKRIRQAEAEYEARIGAWAEAERVYKRAQSRAYLQVEGKNVAEREARAEEFLLGDGENVNDLRYAAHLAEGMMNAAKLALQNRASELSALQSEASLAREEARFMGTAPAEVIPT